MPETLHTRTRNRRSARRSAGRKAAAGPQGTAPRSGDPMSARLRAASHPIDQLVAGNAVLVAEFLKLLDINLIGQVMQRIVSGRGVTQAEQRVNHPLPAIRHGDHRTLSSTCRRGAMAPAGRQLTEWLLTEGGPRSSQHSVPPGPRVAPRARCGNHAVTPGTISPAWLRGTPGGRPGRQRAACLVGQRDRYQARLQ